MGGGLKNRNIMRYREIWLNEITQLTNRPFIGEDIIINGLNLCNRKTIYASIISYITSENLVDAVKNNSAIKVLFLTEKLVDKVRENVSRDIAFFIVNNPEEEFYKLHEILWEHGFYQCEVDSPKIGKNCKIHASVVIEDNVIVGDNVIIGPNSVIRRGSVIENNVRIGCCSVIGSEGFQGIRFTNGESHVITHVGGTHICTNVCIGDNTTVGNALFEGETMIGENTKVDNHVHIAHNLTIGENNIITACCLLMGSSVLENNVWLAPNVVVMNKKVIHERGFVGSMSLVTKDVPEGVTVVGIPAKEWVRK